MAIISGFKAAQVGDVKPFELPVTEMAAGIQARQQQADNAKNAMLAGDSALAIETRPLEEDWNLAQQVRNEYRDSVNELVQGAGGDWSRIDMSQIQSKAIDYAQDNRVRLLTAAKQNADQFNTMRHTIEGQNGEPLNFGMDPSTSALYDTNGKAVNFQAWQLETKLDHVKTAHDLFKQIGHDASAKLGWTEGDGDWYMWWQNNKDTYRDNHSQIDTVIENAVDDYIYTKEGNQYYRQIKQDLINNGSSEEEADTIARDKIENLIFWTGESKKIQELDSTSNRSLHIKPQQKAPSYGRGSRGGSGSDEPPPKKIVSKEDLTYTVEGVSYGGFSTAGEYASNITSDNIIIEDLPSMNVEDITNVHAFDRKLLEVGNVDDTNKGEYGNDIRFTGSLQGLDQEIYGDNYSAEKNRAIVKIWKPGDRVDENTIMTQDDFYEAMMQVSSNTDKNYVDNVFKQSHGDHAWLSMFDITTEGSPGAYRSVVKINPVYQRALENMETKMNDESISQELRDIEAEKYRRLSKKIQDAETYLTFHKEDIDRFSAHKSDLLNKAHVMSMLDHEIMDEALLSGATKKKLDATHGGDVIAASLPDYQRVKTEVIGDEYAKMGWEYYDVIHEILIDNNSSNPDAKKTYALFNNTITNMTSGELKWTDMKTFITEKSQNPQAQSWITEVEQNGGYMPGGMGGSPNQSATKLWKEYYSLKMKEHNLFQGDDNAQVRNQLLTYSGESYKLVLDHEDNNTGNGKLFIQDQSKNMTGIIQSNIKGQTKDRLMEEGKLDPAVIKYFQLSEEAMSSYNTVGNIYFVGKDMKDNAYINQTLTKHMKVAMDDPSNLIRRRIYDDVGDTKLDEEFNPMLIENIMQKRAEMNNTTPDEERQKWLEDGMLGVFFDRNNEDKPFNLAYSLKDPETGQKYDLEVSFTPSEEQLHIMGYTALHTNYLSQINAGLESNNNVYFDLNGANTTTRYYVAPIDMPASGISRGEIYTLGNGDIENTFSTGSKPQKFSSYVEVIDHHNQRAYPNKGTIDYLVQLYHTLSENPTMDPTVLGLDPETSAQDIYKMISMETGSYEVADQALDQSTPGSGNFNMGAGTVTTAPQNQYTNSWYQQTQTINPNSSNIDSKEQRLSYIASQTDLVEERENGSFVFTESTRPDENTLAEVAFSIRPEYSQMTWTLDENDQAYPIDIRNLDEVDMSEFNNINTASSGVKTRLMPEVTGFMNDIDMIFNSVTDGSDLTDIFGGEYNVNDMNVLNTIIKTNNDGTYVEPVTITSGLRSLQDNTWAYRNNLQGLTTSQHMYGNSIDVRTENANPGWEGGAALWEFLKTPSGQAILQKHGLRAFYHDAGTGYHIDISTGTSGWPPGTVVEEAQPRSRNYNYYGAKPNELK